MSRSFAPFNGTYTDTDGNLRDILTHQVVTENQQGGSPINGAFYAADGAVHDLSEVLTGGGSGGGLPAIKLSNVSATGDITLDFSGLPAQIPVISLMQTTNAAITASVSGASTGVGFIYYSAHYANGTSEIMSMTLAGKTFNVRNNSDVKLLLVQFNGTGVNGAWELDDIPDAATVASFAHLTTGSGMGWRSASDASMPANSSVTAFAGMPTYDNGRPNRFPSSALGTIVTFSDGSYIEAVGSTGSVVMAYKAADGTVLRTLGSGRNWASDADSETTLPANTTIASLGSGTSYIRVNAMGNVPWDLSDVYSDLLTRINALAQAVTNLELAFPAPPQSGTFTLQSVDGVVQWV